VRPEVIELWRGTVPMPDDLDVRLKGRIHNRIYLGDHAAFSVATETLGDVLVRAPKTSPALQEGFVPGETVGLGWRNRQALALADS